MNIPRVSAAWGVSGHISTQEAFLETCLTNKHSFPVIGCWDGKPFGFFEIYWTKEDQLGKYVQQVDDWDRGFHVLVGEEEFRGKERVKVWLSALVHYCWLADMRTQRVFLEPRVDNEKYAQLNKVTRSMLMRNRFIAHLQDVGFCKESEVAFPFKQAAVMRINRSMWNAPAI